MISTMAFWKKLKIKMRQIKRLVISKSKQEKGRAERNFRAVKTLYFHDGSMSLYICSNQQNAQYQKEIKGKL